MAKNSLWTMDRYKEIYSLLKNVLEDEGYCLYDLELGLDSSSPIRVFVSNEDYRGAINVGTCSRLCKIIEPILRAKGILSDNRELEVSSPGVNRKLKIAEHYDAVIGSEVKIKYREGNHGKTICGRLIERRDDVVVICSGEDKDNGQDRRIEIGIDDVISANVEYDFSSKRPCN